MKYTTRQHTIIEHFANVYAEFGKGADVKPILVWTSEKTGFIYPQEVEELIDSGCEFFVVEYPKVCNMWTSPNFKIAKAIAAYQSKQKFIVASFYTKMWAARAVNAACGVQVPAQGIRGRRNGKPIT